MNATRREFALSGVALAAVGCVHGERSATATEGRTMAQTTQRSGILVPQRFIPTPTTISPEAQAFLSHAPPVEQGRQPDVSDAAGWRAYITDANRGMLSLTMSMAAPYPAETATHQLSASELHEIIPRSLDARNAEKVILDLHGGGYIVGGGEVSVYSAMPIASLARMRTYSLDYRMPPDHPYPAALDDAVEAYRWLLQRYAPGAIAVRGASAGGNLGPAMLLKARQLGLPMPGACVLHSPAADLSFSGDTFETNAVIDIILKHRSPELSQLYAPGRDLRDPLISPAFAEYSAEFPPTIITSGTRDLLLSSGVMLHRALRKAGVKAELHLWEAMTHAPFFGAPEEAELMGEHVRFIEEHLLAV